MKTKIRSVKEVVTRNRAYAARKKCDACVGAGVVAGSQCEKCGGFGRIVVSQHVDY